MHDELLRMVARAAATTRCALGVERARRRNLRAALVDNRSRTRAADALTRRIVVDQVIIDV